MHVEYPYHSTAPCHTHRYLHEVVENCLKALGSRLVLDVGCGNGALAGRLLQLGYDVYGIDASASGIALAKAAYGEDRFWAMDVESQTLPEPLRGLAFDTVVSTEVVEHLYAPARYAAFCHAVLASRRGHLVVSTPYHGYWKNLALAFSGKLDGHFTVLWEGGHIKFFSRKTLTALLSDAGFAVRSFHGAGRLPYLWKSMVVVAQAQVLATSKASTTTMPAP